MDNLEYSAALDKLKGENAALRSRLDSIDKNRKRALISAAAICIIGVIAAAVIAFLLTDNAYRINKSVKDAGEENTKIVFNETDYRPMTEFENYYFNYYYGSYGAGLKSELKDSKYASYTSSNGEESRVVVNCARFADFIALTVNSKQYYYRDSSAVKADVNEESLSAIAFDYTSISDVRGDMGFSSFIDNYYTKRDNPKVIEAFLSFYENKGEPVDKSITDLYMGSNPRRLTATLLLDESAREELSAPIGEFFTDGKDNVYYYDYIDTQAYSVGKELGEYVYK